MVNYWRKRCKICGDKLIKKGFDKANNQIWYCKHCHRYYVFKRKDNHDRLWIYRYIDFLLENKKIRDFNVSKSTFYRKINKFCWCLMVVIYFLMYYIYLFFETLLEN